MWFPAPGMSSFALVEARLVPDGVGQGTLILGRVRPLVLWRVLMSVVLALVLFFALQLGSGLGEERVGALLTPLLANVFFFLVWSRSLLRCDRNLRRWLRAELQAVPRAG